MVAHSLILIKAKGAAILYMVDFVATLLCFNSHSQRNIIKWEVHIGFHLNCDHLIVFYVVPRYKSRHRLQVQILAYYILIYL